MITDWIEHPAVQREYDRYSGYGQRIDEKKLVTTLDNDKTLSADNMEERIREAFKQSMVLDPHKPLPIALVFS